MAVEKQQLCQRPQQPSLARNLALFLTFVGLISISRWTICGRLAEISQISGNNGNHFLIVWIISGSIFLNIIWENQGPHPRDRSPSSVYTHLLAAPFSRTAASVRRCGAVQRIAFINLECILKLNRNQSGPYFRNTPYMLEVCGGFTGSRLYRRRL